jgi:hypothetical protein
VSYIVKVQLSTGPRLTTAEALEEAKHIVESLDQAALGYLVDRVEILDEYEEDAQ